MGNSLFNYGFENFEKVDMKVSMEPVPFKVLPCDKYILKNNGNTYPFYYQTNVYVTVPKGTKRSQLTKRQAVLQNAAGPLRLKSKYYYKKQLISTKAHDVYFEAAHLGEGAGRYLYASIISDYTNISITHALKNIENKICIIGSRERPHSVEILDEYTECNHNIETAYLSNSKYLPQLETPDKVNEILQVFLNNQ